MLTISPTTKLPALFRLTHNLRAIVNLHTKVYVEAHNDARFYSSIYSILMKRCADIKEVYKASCTKYEKTNFLSRRYQLGFYSVANTSDGGGGGCRAVMDVLSRDCESRTLSKKITDGDETTFDNWLEGKALEITEPFGILDRDYQENGSAKHKFASKLVSLERHSLENFLFDPFILIQLLGNDDVKKISNISIRRSCKKLIAHKLIPHKDKRRYDTDGSRENDDLQLIVDEFFLALLSIAHDKLTNGERSSSEETEKKIRNRSWRFRNADDDLAKGELIASDLAKIIKSAAETVDLGVDVGYNRAEHFDQLVRDRCKLQEIVIDNKDRNRFNMVCDDIVKPEKIVQYRKIFHVIEERKKNPLVSLRYFGHKDISVIIDRGSILTVKYPLLFLELRGHDIGDAFPLCIQGEKLTAKLLDRLLENKETIIPLDLAKIFFRLNRGLRKQACENVETLETEVAEVEDEIIISSLTETNAAQVIVVNGTFCTKPLASSWSTYRVDGLEQLLSLRLAGIDIAVSNAKIIHEHIFLSPVSIIARRATTVIPLIYVATSKPAHAVGIILDKISGADSADLLYKATYLDPENNPIPTAVIRIITSSLPDNAHISFEQRFVEEQLYSNNCGPKLIEDLYEAVSGKKGVPQHLITYAHSELLERALYTEAGYVTRNVSFTMSRNLDLSTALILRAILCISDSTQHTFLDKINILVGVSRWILVQLKNIIVHHKDLTDCRTSRYGINRRMSDELRTKDFRSALHDKGDLASDFVLEDAGRLLDLIRLYQAPTLNNANHVATCSLRLYSIHSCSPFAVAVSTVDYVSAISAKI